MGERLSYFLFGSSLGVFLVLCGLYVQRAVPAYGARFRERLPSPETTEMVGRLAGVLVTLMGVAMIPITAWLVALPP